MSIGLVCFYPLHAMSNLDLRTLEYIHVTWMKWAKYIVGPTDNKTSFLDTNISHLVKICAYEIIFNLKLCDLKHY